MRISIISLILSLVLTIFSQGCNDHQGVQDFLSDSIDVYTHLKPNDEWYCGRHTYGKDSIVGNTLNYRLATDSKRIGVDIDITILELHPRITANLLSFIHGEFLVHGFINEGDTVAPFGIKEKSDNGFTQSEIIHMVLDWEGERFYNELPQILEYGVKWGYNIAIDIYPVFLNENYVTYRKYTHYYTGGAHGNYSSFLQTYNRKTGESVDLDDIIIPEKLEKVRERVAYHMAAKYPIYSSVNSIESYLDSLNRWSGLTNSSVILGFKKENEREQITLNNYPINDPGLHGVGLVFTYEKYHLTPGCDGCPVIVLTYDEIRDCLKEPFNHYHSNLDEFEKYQTNDSYDTAYCYTESQLDSVRAAWSPADDGKPWPRNIIDWYKHRGRKIRQHYKLCDIIGTWIGYGHIYDPRKILTIYPNGRFSNISEEALKKDSIGEMTYNYTRTVQGTYNYDSNKNILMLNNWVDMELNDENLEAYVKQKDPENKYLIIHSIEKDTMYVADQIGDLWPFFRK